MLERKGWTRSTLKGGDQITVQGYRAKSEPFVAAARMIELPGGTKLVAADDGDGGPKIESRESSELRVQSVQLNAGVGGSELPVGLGEVLVEVSLPCHTDSEVAVIFNDGSD